MSKNLGRVAYIIALAALKKKGGTGGGGSGGNSESVYEYAVKNNVTNLPETDFNKAWKESLNPKPFKDQLLQYFIEIGYNQSDLTQANKYILQLINGEIKPSETFYESMAKLGFTSKPAIDKTMTSLLDGTLVMTEFYNNLVNNLGYDKDYDTMQSRIYDLFTKEFLESKDYIDPYEYAHKLNENLTRDEFDARYMDMANNTYIYTLAQKYVPDITNSTVDQILTDLFSGKFYNEDCDCDLLQMIKDLYPDTELQDDSIKQYLLALVTGELNDQPWKLAQSLGTDLDPPQTHEDFDEWYRKLLVLHDLAEPGEEFNIYRFYVDKLNYVGTEEELYSALYTLANMWITGSNAEGTNDNIYDVYDGNYLIIPDNPCNCDNKTLYQLYLDIPHANGVMDEEDFNKRIDDLTQQVLGLDGGGNDIYEGNFKEKDPITIAQKNLYELYCDISNVDNRITEDEFNYKFNAYMLSLLPEFVGAEDAFGNLNPDEKFDGLWKEKEDIEIPNQKTLYQLFLDCGMDSSDISKELFDKKMSDLAGKSNLPYGISGNAEIDDTWSGDYKVHENKPDKTLYQLYLEIPNLLNPMSETDFNKRINDLTQQILWISGEGNDIYEGNYLEKIPVEITQKNLYELYCDISEVNNRLTEKEFNDKFNSYMLSLLPEIVDGGNSNNKVDQNTVYDGQWLEKDFDYNKSLYQLFIDCGMNPSDISQEQFNQKMSDFAGKSNLPYSISGSGEEQYFGSYSGSVISNEFFNYILSLGYRNSKKEMEKQLLDLLSYDLIGNIDGGDSDNTDDILPGQKYEGNFDVNNVVTQDFVSYMKSLGWGGETSALNQIMLDFANGLVDGVIDGNR